MTIILRTQKMCNPEPSSPWATRVRVMKCDRVVQYVLWHTVRICTCCLRWCSVHTWPAEFLCPSAPKFAKWSASWLCSRKMCVIVGQSHGINDHFSGSFQGAFNQWGQAGCKFGSSRTVLTRSLCKRRHLDERLTHNLAWSKSAPSRL